MSPISDSSALCFSSCLVSNWWTSAKKCPRVWNGPWCSRTTKIITHKLYDGYDTGSYVLGTVLSLVEREALSTLVWWEVLGLRLRDLYPLTLCNSAKPLRHNQAELDQWARLGQCQVAYTLPVLNFIFKGLHWNMRTFALKYVTIFLTWSRLLSPKYWLIGKWSGHYLCILCILPLPALLF